MQRRRSVGVLCINVGIIALYKDLDFIQGSTIARPVKHRKTLKTYFHKQAMCKWANRTMILILCRNEMGSEKGLTMSSLRDTRSGLADRAACNNSTEPVFADSSGSSPVSSLHTQEQGAGLITGMPDRTLAGHVAEISWCQPQDALTLSERPWC